ncbi:hypothetical protein SY83_17700 [Paenibacillus swuensis]|uniref:DUF4829 domain-containing protein n=1 Tax=Paenibacillus swuensis TaxID=1178515 RepID=A0A172TLA6_9BACL|nr:hypothetical protein [Paenibacillus swuensis]ANE47818.1 hypothetical protein SY83_17700 [Paenibacillus swuensis]
MFQFKRFTKPFLYVLLVIILTSCSEATHPEYIPESNFTGDQLEIVKLINLRMKYIFEENKDEYVKLTAPNSPVSNPPSYKVKKVKVMEEIHIREQKNIYEASVRTNEVTFNKEEMTYVYVFWKGKQPNDTWLIMDID